MTMETVQIRLTKESGVKNMTSQKSGMFWHIHHDRLVEWSDNIDERIDYIKKEKPSNEVEIHLRLMKRVNGKLPDEFVNAVKARNKAIKARDKAWNKAIKARNKAWYKTRDKADEAWYKAIKARDKADKANKARKKYESEIETLHKIECPDCTWDGKTVKL
jgi:hypothetical protein